MNWLLSLDVVEGPVPWIVWGLAAVGVIVLLVRKPTARWAVRALIGILAGAIIGVGAVLTAQVTDAFGGDLPESVAWWAGAGFAAVGLGIVSLWDSQAWRKVVAVLAIIVSLIATALGINAAFGINQTLGSIFGVSTLEGVDNLGGPNPSASPAGPVYQHWVPPADMPQQGKVGELTGPSAIPSSAGFKPRDASIYLPPAAQVQNAPALPLVVFMMGKPGNPEPTFIQRALDDVAAKNKGLAPIVIIADQLGDPGQDPVCADSQKFGGVSTYFNKDIVEYAKSKLNVIEDHSYWTIAGYSNGGACAFKWAAEHPDIWGHLIDISGDEFPGSEDQAGAVRDGFGGDQQAYEAAKPESLLKANQGKYAGHTAVFTVGENDPGFIPGAQRASDLAKAAGFDTTYYVVPGADHVETALDGGLPYAFEALYPHIGLAAPK